MDRLFLILAIVGVIFGSALEWWTGSGLSAHPRLTSAQSTSPSSAAVNAIAEVPQTIAAFTPGIGSVRAGKSVTVAILYTILGLVLIFAFVLFATTFIGRGMAIK